MASDPGPAAVYLAEVHRDLDAASLWGSFGAEDFDWQRHVPRLLAAVEAVLRDHEPRTRIPPNRHYAICRACSRIWPCATVQDITKALLGKGESDAPE